MNRGGQVIHGDWGCVEYMTWQSMFQRCYNINKKKYEAYRNRGISVCKRWSNYINFLKDMGRRPKGKFSLDRINNEGDYKPSNCRWATVTEQRKNQRRVYNMNKRLDIEQCEAVTKEGPRCKNYSTHGHYCGLHYGDGDC